LNPGPELLLVGAVAAVGVLHTIVPDHWLPIVLMARQREWSRAETARAALQAGTGHVVSTLAIALIVWIAGVAVAKSFGGVVDTASSLALIGFGGWIALSAWREELHQHSHSLGQEIRAAMDSDRHTHELGADAGNRRKGRTALLLIVGSSPMVEGIPAFFAASRYGAGLIATMGAVFAVCTIATYVIVCTTAAARLQRIQFGSLERYGEVLSGAAIALVGLAFWVWPAIR
jgi:hypothetical protein